MPEVAWNLTSPADASSANSADDQIRSDITALATLIGESFYWPGSAATQGASTSSSGELRPGTARPAYGSSVRVGGAPNGTLGYDTLNTTFWHAGTRPHVVGGPSMAEHVPTTGLGEARWLVSSGSYPVVLSHTGGDETSWNFGFVYSVPPVVLASLSTTGFVWTINSVSTRKMTSYYSKLGTSTGTSLQTFYWVSFGTVDY